MISGGFLNTGVKYTERGPYEGSLSERTESGKRKEMNCAEAGEVQRADVWGKQV